MTGRRLTGPTIRTGPGDSDPPEATPWDELTGDVEALRERVEDLERELGEIEAERDRLARVLSVERSDASAAPDGWTLGDNGCWRYRGVLVYRSGRGGWTWSGRGAHGRAQTALEAMEAADAALAEIKT